MSPRRDFPLLLSPPKKNPTTIKLCVFIHLNFFSSMFCLKKLQRKGKRGKKKGIGDKKGRGKSHPKALRDIHVLFSEECIQRSFVEFLTLILLANSGICVAELLSFLQDCYKTQAMAVLRIEQLQKCRGMKLKRLIISFKSNIFGKKTKSVKKKAVKNGSTKHLQSHQMLKDSFKSVSSTVKYSCCLTSLTAPFPQGLESDLTSNLQKLIKFLYCNSSQTITYYGFYMGILFSRRSQ